MTTMTMMTTRVLSEVGPLCAGSWMVKPWLVVPEGGGVV